MSVKQSPHEEYDRGFSNGWDACAARAQPAQAGQALSDEDVLRAAARTLDSEVVEVSPLSCIKDFARAIEQAVLAKRVPMTDEQIQSVYLENMLYQDGLTPSGMVRVTRAIERAQAVIAKGGIVGEKGGA